MKVPMCSKSKDIIEPVMKPQWWMRMKELASDAIKVVKDGKIKVWYLSFSPSQIVIEAQSSKKPI